MISEQDLDAMGYSYYMDHKEQSVSEMVKEFATKTDQIPDKKLYEQLIIEEFQEWDDALDCPLEEIKELADLVYVIYGYANACGYDLDEAIRRVHQNNLGRCIQPDGTIQRRADGKIIKNPNYPAVDLSDLV